MIADHLKKMSITMRMILYIYLLLLIQMLIIGWFSYTWISNYQRDTNINYTQLTNNGLLQQINYIRSYYESQSEKILSNRTIESILIDNLEKRPGSPILQDLSTVNNLLYDPSDSYYSVIVQNNGIIYQPYSSRYVSTTFGRIITTEVYLKSHESISNTWLAVNENMMTNKKEPFLFLCRTIKSLEIRPRVLGQLMIQIPIEALSDIFKTSNLKSGEYYAIIDINGNFIFHTSYLELMGEKPDKNILSIMSEKREGWQIIKDNREEYLISYSNYTDNGWNVLHVMPMRYISANAEAVRNYVLLIMLISFLFLLPLLIFLAGNLSRPIKKLNTTVEKFGKGDLTVREETGRMDEIGHLQNSFNKMAEDINNLLVRITDEHKQRRILELNILEYQINPHFLYNSLDSINYMAKVSGSKDIEDMVCALAKYLRVGLSKGKEFYTIRDELEHVRQYLFINMIRFKDCFSFEIQAKPDVLEYITIKIVLQPVVENAIKYGVNKKTTNGHIRISAEKKGASILFEVSDNGPGIQPLKLQALHNLLDDHAIDPESENGFGLYNINQRIWLQYGEGYGLKIDSSLESGTVVQIRIPASEREN